MELCQIKNSGILSNKGGLITSDISLVKNDTVVTDDAEILNYNCINTVEKSSGKKPISLAKKTGISDDRQTIRLILDKYKNHHSSYYSKPRVSPGYFHFSRDRQSGSCKTIKILS